MKTIISIFGTEDTGKTSVIKNIFYKLNQDNTFNNVDLAPNEVKAIGMYNNKLIGIESVGDPDSRQGKSLQEFVDKGCEIIICASRTKGETKENVDNIVKNHNYQLIRTSNFFGGIKGMLNNQIDLNTEFSIAILKLIDKL